VLERSREKLEHLEAQLREIESGDHPGGGEQASGG
jgi:BMFP domain-containing protein YqiC